jgi:hypothetical protein
MLFAVSVFGALFAINIGDRATDAIQLSRHNNCTAQQRMNVLLVRTFHRMEEAETSHIPHASDPGITLLRVAILHDFAQMYRTFPPVECP